MKTLTIIIFLTFGSLIWAQEKPSEVPAETKVENSDQWHFGLGGSLSLRSKLRFDTVTATGVTGNLVADLDYSNVFSIELEARKINQMSWGLMGGLTFDGERQLTGGSITGGGVSLVVSDSDPSKIQATVIYGNAVYRWNQFYLPFGLNISAIKFTAASSFTGTSSASGGVGAQVGFGVYVKDNFVIEGYSRAVAVKLSSTSSSSTTNYGTGFLSNVMLTGKYIF